jgi:hypothetical protein
MGKVDCTVPLKPKRQTINSKFNPEPELPGALTRKYQNSLGKRPSMMADSHNPVEFRAKWDVS